MSKPFRHLSIRVPWHDAGWNGCVCHNPKANTACLALQRIQQSRDDDAEEEVAGQSIDTLPKNQWPACMGERGTFMAPFAYERTMVQPYSRTSDLHKHILPYTMQCPPYSAQAIPFGWMTKERAWVIAEIYNLDVDQQREPTTPDWLKKRAWVQHHENQKALLEKFFDPIEPHQSLCFFYAKETPLTEDPRRVIIGVGFVESVSPLREFDYSQPKDIRAYTWERTIRHSIRPEGHPDGLHGFLLPYHAILQKAAEDPELNPADYVAFAPEYATGEFSYGSEHVSHDTAIAALLACKDALEKAREIVDAPCNAMLEWIDDRLNELWIIRGPYPGLGSVLKAFGITYGAFLAYELTKDVGETDDPWPRVDQAFQKPKTLPKLFRQDVFSLGPVWNALKQSNPDRLALLKLLARLYLSTEQATRLYVQEDRTAAGIVCQDSELLANPYLLYELDRFSVGPLTVWQVDRGVHPRDIIEEHHPLPEPSAMQGWADPRRLRAFVLETLERAAQDGHTLLPRDTVIQTIRDYPLEPKCSVTGDILAPFEATFAPHIHIFTLADGRPAYQLERFKRIGELMRTTIEKRLKGKRHTVQADWRTRLDDALKQDETDPDEEQARLDDALKQDETDPDEEQARKEKSAALAELAAARFSILIGPAGTGKTTLLKVLCNEPTIKKGGVVLLAPTGKARVQLETKIGLPAQTLAQFLFRHGRYHGETGRYLVLFEPGQRVDVGKTIIVDEASMLTEEQLGSLIDTIKGYDRLILVGDPRQLPPIGAGKPFFDIVQRLAPENNAALFPHIAPSYTELTIQRRQVEEGKGKRLDKSQLYDVRFAEWFSGRPIPPSEDDIFGLVASAKPENRIRVHTWEREDELQELLKDVIHEELELDTREFEEWLGGTENNGFFYFSHEQAAEAAEAWQILSPVRGNIPGVREINRLIKHTYRRETLHWAQEQKRRGYPTDQSAVTEPRGPEEIVYGDKVMNLSNHERIYVYPKDGALQYLANGEMGIVVGEFKKKGKSERPWRTQVAFSSQPKHTYSFSEKDFGEGGSFLELAYATTIHKAQGSEFGLCIIVIPNVRRMLSRELLYTALTRQRERVVLLVQGESASVLREYSSDKHSEIARRFTNLFATPAPIVVSDGKQERMLDAWLIHRSSRGELMRSKSEVIIANMLNAADIDYTYEKPLQGSDGQVRYPDFTIEDDGSGITYYWEHCGMLQNDDYRQRWEYKRKWYAAQGIEEGESGGENGVLIVTEDDAQGGIDSQAIQQYVEMIRGA